ncbi:type I polyketide synthase [Planktothrix pseudagardhii]|uniref:Oleandomycin polyketide synthase, modules 5 and 6 n=1 Tax=Planktothrix pseudagardhii TaxID=132604 RepID=A0A9W4D608_9CYAN|nr:type I polyketide synthase [Planktothrix pseudagardhii]CAD5970599.1 Oleandomycin polyketide synthase, modules 5 and 6 [Planktothrix pseudagardhii]
MNQPLSSQQLLELLEQVHNKLEAVEREKTEPIAIIGVGCRFPGNVNDPASFWQLLRKGVDAVTEIPSDRWDIEAFYDPDPKTPLKAYTKQGSFLQQIDQFDPLFFGISPREAASLDPQQRLLLEVTWEALENAAIAPHQLKNSRTSVYVGICTDDYVSNQIINATTRLVTQALTNQEVSTSVDAYTGIGGARSIAVGRISHFLGLQGPNIQLDTACSSSLIAVHLACCGLRLKECNLALVGGVNLILSPGNTIARCQMKALAPDGRCKTFDATADGYGQGEGCGMVVLKRLSDAISDGDRILAVIRGSATNHDGPSGGLTVPNKKAQKDVIEQALKNARIEPHQVSYVEAHGTGTTLGDPIELEALAAVYGKNRPINQPLIVGSVKTNFGHLEAAAGISSLIKVALAIKNQEIPPHLHFNQPNPYIPWNQIPVVISTKVMPWEKAPRLAGVSSFGMSGSNVHVILSEAPETVKSEEGLKRPVNLLMLSAKTENALKDLVYRYQNHLQLYPEQKLQDVCFTANMGRSHFQYRLALLATTSAELGEKLANFQRENQASGAFYGQVLNTSRQPKIAFLFTGQGAQYHRMGWDLYQTQPRFREVLQECNRILQPYLEIPLLEALYSNLENPDLINQTVYTQPALFAIEYALFELWKSWGIKPDILMGHSVGEYVAATVAGVFSLEEGLKLIAARGRLMQLTQAGEMVSVLASESVVRKAITPYNSQVSIAAFNGIESIIISGTKEAIRAICSHLESQGIKTKQLQVSHAFHSPLMEPILTEFAAITQQITYNLPQIPLISNITGQQNDQSIATSQYWVQHLRQPVKFAQGIDTLHQQGYTVFLEIGPQPILLGMGRQCLPGNKAIWLPSLHPPQIDSQQTFSSLAQLYVQGFKINYPYRTDILPVKVSLPTYPFQRQRYWIESLQDTQKKLTSITRQNNISPLKQLNQKDIEELVQKLEKTDKFSDSQLEILVNSLNDLTKKEQSQLSEPNIKDWLYKIEWKPLNITQSHHIFQPSHWLIFADSKGLGQALKNQLQHQGHECSLVYRADTYQHSETGIYRLNPEQPQEFDQLYQAIIESSTLPLQKIIHLWSLDATTEQNLTISALEELQLWGCGSVIHWLQAVIKNSKTILPQLWLITRGSQPVLNTEKIAVTQSSLWGLGRVISWEYSHLWGGLIDLDSQGSQQEIETLLQLVIDSQKQDHLALRSDQLYKASLVKYNLKPQKVEMSFYEEATYLITGGLGDLGLHTAEWMVSKGAKHLVLISRRPASEQAQKKIERLETAGASIHIFSSDISIETDLSKIIDKIQTSLPPLRGVIHAAGILDDGILQNMSWERFTQVIAPKVKGACHLHKLTQKLSLDFFVCFSSMASLLGSPGQGNYAAANAFIDALAYYRRQIGLPGLTINWGAWSQAGMATRVASQYQNRWKTFGISSITPKQGLQILGELLLNQSSPQVGVLAADWSILTEQWSLGYPNSLLSELLEQEKLEQKPAITPKNNQGILEKLKATTEAEYKDILQNYLLSLVAKTLQINLSEIPTQRNLIELGMDSLMTMEIVNQLSQDLNFIIYPREFYERPRIDSLTEYLSAELRKQDTTLSFQQLSSKTLEILETQSIANSPFVTPSSERLPGIIFILSSPRSGSTLLRVMLAGHPGLFSPPELHLLPFNTMREREEKLKLSHLGEGLQKALMAIYKSSAAASQALIQDKCLQNFSIQQMYQEIQQNIAPRLLVDKSPSYAINRAILERAESLFANSKYIHLVRHPYSVIESFVRMRMQKLAGLGDGNPYQFAEEIWTKSNQNILDFLTKLEPERHHQIRYEELVQQPDKILSQLCDFLNINFDSALLQPYEGHRMTEGIYESSLSISDPNFLKHSSIDSSLGDQWKTIQLPHDLGKETQQIAQQFNYEFPNSIDRISSVSKREVAQIFQRKNQHEEKFLDFKGKQICLCSWGSQNHPVVLCIHGILEQGLAWQEVALPLANAGYWVVAPDLLGHGRSAHLEIATSYNSLTFLAQIDWVIQELPDQPLFLVGHSMGAMLAAMIASVRPNKIKGLMLVEPPVPAAEKKQEPVNQLTTFLEYFASAPQHPIFPDVATAARRLRQVTPALSEEFSDILAERTTQPCEGGVMWSWDEILRTRSPLSFSSFNGGREQYLAMLKQIKIPTILVYGEHSKLNRPEDLQQQQIAMVEAKRVFVSGGHNLHIEAAYALVSLIKQGLA